MKRERKREVGSLAAGGRAGRTWGSQERVSCGYCAAARKMLFCLSTASPEEEEKEREKKRKMKTLSCRHSATEATLIFTSQSSG